MLVRQQNTLSHIPFGQSSGFLGRFFTKFAGQSKLLQVGWQHWPSPPKNILQRANVLSVQHQQCIISDELSIPQHHLHDLCGVDSNCDPLNSSRSTPAQCKPRFWPSHWVRSHPVCKYDSRKWVRSTECQNLGSGSNWLQFLYTIHAYSFNARKGAHLDSQISIKLFFLLAAKDMELSNISSAVTSPI